MEEPSHRATMRRYSSSGIVFFVLMLFSCSRHNPSSELIIKETLAHRAAVDSNFRDNPNSPFNRDTSIHYNGLRWFLPDAEFYFQSRLYRYQRPETVLVYGTKGEARTQLKYGYFLLDFQGRTFTLNAYKLVTSNPTEAASYGNELSVWFTDETTGKETYEVGRYVDVGEEHRDTNFLYSLNLNNAYNPYCAYSSLYSCAIPRKEDHLGFPVRAGEMKYHH